MRDGTRRQLDNSERRFAEHNILEFGQQLAMLQTDSGRKGADKGVCSDISFTWTHVKCPYLTVCQHSSDILGFQRLEGR